MPYKVWVCIEHEKRNGDYEEMDAPGASVAAFRTYNQAYKFAEKLQAIGENGLEVSPLSQKDKETIANAANRAIQERQGYMQEGSPPQDYGNEWPEVARDQSAEFHALAALLERIGYSGNAGEAYQVSRALLQSAKEYEETDGGR